MQHLISLKDWSREEILGCLDLADQLKLNPDKWASAMERKTLIMIFEKPSLRTRLSFETGCTQMGGHAIYYDTSTSPMGAGKETLHDTMKVMSRFGDIVMARLFEHDHMLEMAEHATIPVINALTNHTHPCQILADFQTIREHKGDLKGLKLTYLGDSNNNVTYSLLYGCAAVGMNMHVACPPDADFSPEEAVMVEARKRAEQTGAELAVTQNLNEALDGADVVYTDSWMSYHIPPEEQEQRIEILKPYQVNSECMALAKPDAIFMNCLPAQRGCEQTAEVIDGPQSVVFDEAENRLHAQKAVMLTLLNAQ